MAKGVFTCFEQILLLSQCFQNLSAAEASESVYMRETVNIVAKGEIAYHEQFLLLPKCFKLDSIQFLFVEIYHVNA